MLGAINFPKLVLFKNSLVSIYGDGSSVMPIKESEEARIQAVYARRQGDAALYSYFNPGHLLMLQQRQRTLLTMLSRDDCTRLDSKKILEIGCGKGYWLREFINWGARPQNITGIDLMEEHVSEARRLCPTGVKVQYGNAAKLDFPDRILTTGGRWFNSNQATVGERGATP